MLQLMDLPPFGVKQHRLDAGETPRVQVAFGMRSDLGCRGADITTQRDVEVSNRGKALFSRRI